MTMQIDDLIKEFSTTPGTAAMVLGGAVTGSRRVSAVAGITIGDTLPYVIREVDGNGNPNGAWEIGIGTYSAANTLARTTVLSSSNANALVSFNSFTKHVTLTMPSYLLKQDVAHVTSYSALRTYLGAATSVIISDKNLGGTFVYDASDTTSADNGGTIIVGGTRRWKRVFAGFVDVRWFGAVMDGTTNDIVALQAANDYCETAGKTLMITGSCLIKAKFILSCAMAGIPRVSKIIVASDFVASGSDATEQEICIRNKNHVFTYTNPNEINIRGVDFLIRKPLALFRLANVKGGLIEDCRFLTDAVGINVLSCFDLYACVKNLTVRHCTISNDTAYNGYGASGLVRNITTAGNYATNNTENVTFEDCTLATTTYDAALTVFGVRGKTRNVTMRRCQIEGHNFRATPAPIPNGTVLLSTYGGVPGASLATIQSAFTSAFNALKTAGGGTLYIQPGVYGFGSTGVNTTWIAVSDLQNVLISAYDAQFTCTSTANVTPNMFVFTNPQNVTIAGMKFKDFGGDTSVNWKGAIAIMVQTTVAHSGFQTYDCQADTCTTFFQAQQDTNRYTFEGFNIHGYVNDCYYGVNPNYTGNNSRADVICTNVRRAFIGYGVNNWEIKANVYHTSGLGSNALVEIAPTFGYPCQNVNVDLTCSGTLDVYNHLCAFYQQSAANEIGVAQDCNVKFYMDGPSSAASNGIVGFIAEPPGSGAIQTTTISKWVNITVSGSFNGTYSGNVVVNPSVSSTSGNSIHVDTALSSRVSLGSLPSYFDLITLPSGWPTAISGVPFNTMKHPVLAMASPAKDSYTIGGASFAAVEGILWDDCTFIDENFTDTALQIGDSANTAQVCDNVKINNSRFYLKQGGVVTSHAVRHIANTGGAMVMNNCHLYADSSPRAITYGFRGLTQVSQSSTSGNLTNALADCTRVTNNPSIDAAGAAVMNCLNVHNNGILGTTDGVVCQTSDVYHISGNRIASDATGIYVTTVGGTTTPSALIENNSIVMNSAGSYAINANGAGVVRMRAVGNRIAGTGKTITGTWVEISGNDWYGTLDQRRSAGYIDADHNTATPVGTFTSASSPTAGTTRRLIGWIKAETNNVSADWKAMYAENANN